MDVKQLITEVAKRHHVMLGPEDPIFVTLTLNELVLSHYIEQVQAALDQAQVQTAAATSQQLETAKETTSKIMTDAAVYLSEQMQATGNALQAQLLEAVQKTLESSQKEAKVLSKAKNIAIGAAITTCITACFVVGIAVAIALHR